MERRGEFAAASLQTESYLEREHNARWTVLGVGYATSGITANVLTLLLPPPNILARDQLNPYLQAVRRKEVEQWQSGADHNVIANSLGKSIAHSSTARIPYSEFSPLTLIGTAFPQRNEVRTHLSWINGNRPVDCARCCRSIFAMYVRANSSILMFALTVTCRTNPVRMPGLSSACDH